MSFRHFVRPGDLYLGRLIAAASRRSLKSQSRDMTDSKRLSTQHAPTSTENFTANLTRRRKARCLRFRNMTQTWIHPLHRSVGFPFSRIPLSQDLNRWRQIMTWHRPARATLNIPVRQPQRIKPTRCLSLHGGVGIAPSFNTYLGSSSTTTIMEMKRLKCSFAVDLRLLNPVTKASTRFRLGHPNCCGRGDLRVHLKRDGWISTMV
jgi:hypothetical protein